MIFKKEQCIKQNGCNECCMSFIMMVGNMDKDDIFRLTHLDTSNIIVKEANTIDKSFLTEKEKKLPWHTIEYVYKCEYLKDGRCSIHNNKPNMCKRFPEIKEDFNDYCMRG